MPHPLSRPAPWQRATALAATLGLLSACAPGGLTQSQRIGSDDGTDSCRAQVVALDSTGNFFGEDILKGAAAGALGGALIGGLVGGDWRGALIGGAIGAAAGATTGYLVALQQQQKDQAAITAQINSDLARENAQIDRAQIAFNQLSDCRFRQAQSLRAAFAQGRMTRPEAESQMGVIRARAQKDIQLAQLLDKQINARADQFEVAADSVDPGVKAQLAAAKAPPTKRVVTRTAAPVKLNPSPDSPEIAQLKPRETVSVTASAAAAPAGYALVETSSGARGYTPVSALQSPPPAPPVVAATGGDDVRSLAGSNAARRDAFAQSVAVTEHAATTGFELAAS